MQCPVWQNLLKCIFSVRKWITQIHSCATFIAFTLPRHNLCMPSLLQINDLIKSIRFENIDDERLRFVFKTLQLRYLWFSLSFQQFEGGEISLDPRMGLFITMNPGYAGRTELPESVKALFRPVMCIVPDLQQICEIMLFSEGFLLAKVWRFFFFFFTRLLLNELGGDPTSNYVSYLFTK